MVLPDAHDLDDTAFLDLVLDRALERLNRDGMVDLDDLLDGREHLRGEVVELLRLAHGISVQRPPTQPQIAGFEVLGEIGRGAMGTVYLARERALERQVALKVLPRSILVSDRARMRFLAEARALARVQHENVVAIHGIVEEGETCAYAMAWIDGTTLARLLSRLQERSNATIADVHRLLGAVIPEEQGAASSLTIFFVRLILRVARGLSAVHRAGLIHRDVKPSNILLTCEGTPLLSDFGLARDDRDAGMTRTGEFVGTPAYAAPEQLRGERDAVDARADVYALGVTLYQTLSGRLPFEGRSTTDLLRRIESGLAPPLREVAPSIPRDLETIVAKAMDPEPPRRYATADDFADDLERLHELRPIAARPAGLFERAAKFARRRREPLMAAAVAAVVVLALAVAYFVRDARQKAIGERVAELLNDARLALLNPRQGERLFSFHVMNMREIASADELSDLTPALEKYEEALRLAPQRADLESEHAVVLAARAFLSRSSPANVVAVAPSAKDWLKQNCPLTSAVAERWTDRNAPPTVSADELAHANATDRRALGLLASLLEEPGLCIDAWSELDLGLGSKSDPLVDAALGQLLIVEEKPELAYPRLLLAVQAFPEAGFLAVDLAHAAIGCQDLKRARSFLDHAREVGGLDPYETDIHVEADLCAALGDEHQRPRPPPPRCRDGRPACVDEFFSIVGEARILDGIRDFVVGAPGLPNAGSIPGYVYLYSGAQRTGSSPKLLKTFAGANIGDWFGAYLSNAGDIDRDGLPEILIGASKSDPGGTTDAGTVYVYSTANTGNFGKVEGLNSLDSLRCGAGIGDVTGDGVPDFLIGAAADPGGLPDAGSVYVFSGRTCDATWWNYGTGWAGTNGVPSLTAAVDPVINGNLQVDLSNSSGVDTRGFLFVGLSSTIIPTTKGGTLLVVPLVTIRITIPAGGRSLSDLLPDDLALCGTHVYVQAIEFDAGASHGLSFTPGLDLAIGGTPWQ